MPNQVKNPVTRAVFLAMEEIDRCQYGETEELTNAMALVNEALRLSRDIINNRPAVPRRLGPVMLEILAEVPEEVIYALDRSPTPASWYLGFSDNTRGVHTAPEDVDTAEDWRAAASKVAFLLHPTGERRNWTELETWQERIREIWTQSKGAR